MGFGAPGAAQTPEFDHFRPAQNSCIKNPDVCNKNYNFIFSFWPISGRTWPRDPVKQVGLGKWYTNHPKLTPETNYKAVS